MTFSSQLFSSQSAAGSEDPSSSNLDSPINDSLRESAGKLEDVLEAAFEESLPSAEVPGGRIHQACMNKNGELSIINLASLLEMIIASPRELLTESEIEAAVKPLFQPAISSVKPDLREAVKKLWLADIIWCVLHRMNDAEFINQATNFLTEMLENMPLDQRTGLIPRNPADRDKEDNRDFLFFPSLLYFQACHQASEILREINQEGEADQWNHRAEITAKNIRIYFWNKKIGLFKSGTILPDLTDVQASALAVYRKAATSGQLMTIAGTFRDNYQKLVKEGMVQRWFPPDTEPPEDPKYYLGMGKKSSPFALEPAGWFAYTLDFVEPRLAEQIIAEATAKTIEIIHTGEKGKSQKKGSELPAASRILAAIYAIQERRAHKKPRRQS